METFGKIMLGLLALEAVTFIGIVLYCLIAAIRGVAAVNPIILIRNKAHKMAATIRNWNLISLKSIIEIVLSFLIIGMFGCIQFLPYYITIPFFILVFAYVVHVCFKKVGS